MKNHGELFEALLSGEELLNDEGSRLYIFAGNLYLRNERGTYCPIGTLLPQDWKLKPRTKTINGIEVPTPP